MRDGRYKHRSARWHEESHQETHCICGVQVRLSLTSYALLSATDQWNTEDGHFDYQDFYAQCVDYFESEPDDEQVVGLLNWWNLCVSLYC